MPQHPETTADLRERLGVPHDAPHVIVFAESSHWDPNWMWTSDDYFEKMVKPNLDQAIEALRTQPRRVYSVECMFFLRMYWEARPDQHDAVRTLVNNGQLRITNSGVTTADTILPSTEALLRDLLLGQEWLRERGLNQEPTLAYFTDSFGMSPALPSLLNAAGFDRTAFTRVDGMYFMGCDYESAKNFPRPGSTAETLEALKTTEFIWRDMNGAEVLAHWNIFNYGQGDMIAHKGMARMYLFPFPHREARSDKDVAGKIEGYAGDLIPFSRTPYVFCPIGLDFVEPLDDLVGLLDRYNENHYADSGIWAVNAGLDDFLALVEPYKAQLPVVEMDPNPYWTGFYTARPLLKQRAYELTDALIYAEALSLLPQNRASADEVQEALAPAWWTAATSNHHDLITGTSPDEVIYGESFPWLEESLATVGSVIDRLSEGVDEPDPAPGDAVMPDYDIHNEDLTLTVRTPYYEAVLSERHGGAITRLAAPDGEAWITAPSNDLVSYRDSGGLWRMGHEFKGGRWKVSDAASRTPVTMTVEATSEGLAVHTTHHLNGETIRRTTWFRNDSPAIRGRISGKAAAGYTINVRLHPTLVFTQLRMDAAGGVVTRPPARVYDPTYWAFQHVAHLEGEEEGMAVLQRYPGAVAYQPTEGWVELVALRNATKEKAWGILPILANPAKGEVHDPYDFDYAFQFMEGSHGASHSLHSLPAELFPQREAPALFTVDREDVTVTAVKPAWRGEGVIVRLVAPRPPGTVTLSCRSLPVRKVMLCDARERDLGELTVNGDRVIFEMTGTIASVRVL
jgi:hypothetical protein